MHDFGTRPLGGATTALYGGFALMLLALVAFLAFAFEDREATGTLAACSGATDPPRCAESARNWAAIRTEAYVGAGTALAGGLLAIAHGLLRERRAAAAARRSRKAPPPAA